MNRLTRIASVLAAVDSAPGWTPAEAAGLAWAPDGTDTLDELWNDCVTFEQ